MVDRARLGPPPRVAPATSVYEVEVRLRHKGLPGIPRDAFDRIEAALFGCSWSRVDPVRHEHIYYYTNPHDGLPMRTITVPYRAGEGGLQPRHERKLPLAHLDMKSEFWDLRAALSLERTFSQPGEVKHISGPVDTTRVAVRQRRSFVLERPYGTIRYDLSNVWYGVNEGDALAAINTIEPHFQVEVEVELPRPPATATPSPPTLTSDGLTIAASLLMKACDLMGAATYHRQAHRPPTLTPATERLVQHPLPDASATKTGATAAGSSRSRNRPPRTPAPPPPVEQPPGPTPSLLNSVPGELEPMLIL
jgi:hypothetical protein